MNDIDDFVNQPVVTNDSWIFRHTFCKNGQPWDLTGATVFLFLSDPDGDRQGPFTANIDDPANGKVSYQVDTTVLATAGDWVKQWFIQATGLSWWSAEETFSVLTHL